MGSGTPARAAGLRSLWVRSAWRRVALRHGFDPVDAAPPAPGEDLGAALVGGEDAGSAARWCTIRQCVREVKPQRGRARDFWLLSCRICGDESVRADAEAIACAVACLRELGVAPAHAKVRISHRGAVQSLLLRRGVGADDLARWFPLLQRAGKMSNDDFLSGAVELGMEARTALDVLRVLTLSTPFEEPTTQMFLSEQAGGRGPEYFKALFADLRALGVAEWCVLNLGIVRGGAGYTGMVFEVHEAAGRGRSIAGGGRSGGEDGPACVGFDMGDIALAQLLGDRGLWPSEAALAERLGVRVDAFVAAVDDAGALAALLPTVAALRRAGLHVRYAPESVADLDETEGRARGESPGGARQVVVLEPGPGGVAARVKSLESGAVHPEAIPLEQLGAFFLN